ncbi:MAG: trigger factor [Leptolyngbyaceae cyanobacterium T60_A2020_046]|nr:trigger factor [Leptolyngbyaceae cyanobacterium T60_A2020_046]
MKVTQEKLPDSQVGLQIEIPAEMSKQTYEQVLQQLMRTANIPGFRKGKVPRQIFLQRVGSAQVKAAALEELVQKAVDAAIEQESIEAIGNYQLKTAFENLIQDFIPGEPLTIEASVDVPPRVTLKAYTGLTTQAEDVEYDTAIVDETLERYQLNLATLVPVEDRPVQMDDVAVIDFVGKTQDEDGNLEAFEGGSAEDFQLDIKPGGFIEGFVEGIVGMTLGETKEVSVTFPDTYAQESLAGKPAIFTITVKEIKEKELPDLDDDFAQEVSEFETLEALRASLEERFRKEAESQKKDNQREAILSVLVEQLDAEIPETLVRREMNYLVSQTAIQLSQQGLDVNKLLTPDIIENMRERARPEAIARLQRTLALGEVAKQESITVADEDIQARMDEMLSEVSDPNAIDLDRLREVVQEDLLQDKVLTWLAEHNTIEWVPEGSLSDDEDEGDEDDVSAGDAIVDVEAAVNEVSDEVSNDESEATEA